MSENSDFKNIIIATDDAIVHVYGHMIDVLANYFNKHAASAAGGFKTATEQVKFLIKNDHFVYKTGDGLDFYESVESLVNLRTSTNILFRIKIKSLLPDFSDSYEIVDPLCGVVVHVWNERKNENDTQVKIISRKGGFTNVY